MMGTDDGETKQPGLYARLNANKSTLSKWEILEKKYTIYRYTSFIMIKTGTTANKTAGLFSIVILLGFSKVVIVYCAKNT